MALAVKTIITPMNEETILLIEKEGSKAPTFTVALQRKGYRVNVAPTGVMALDCARLVRPALIILNAASLGSTGVRICRQLRDAIGAPIIHILAEGTYLDPSQEISCEIVLTLPFTPRKLINHIKRLLPTARRDVIVSGPIRLAPSARVVEVNGHETHLTPKTAVLLQVFLQHPGEVLDRGYLMRQVWDTNYVGDTRTLDVHVRWVREAIEAEPAAPRHILTVRGVGYRFVPDPSDEGKGSRQG